MTVRVGINGFGRIGRMVFRAARDFDDVEIVGINDLLEPDYLAYMLKYDSVHGRFPGEVAIEGGALIVDGSSIRLTAERDPAALNWGDLDVDVVVESTGLFLTAETAQKHIDAGARKVIMRPSTGLTCSSALMAAASGISQPRSTASVRARLCALNRPSRRLCNSPEPQLESKRMRRPSARGSTSPMCR